MVYNYSRLVKPPGPFLNIKVSADAQSRQIDVLALLDTGSDGATLPEYVQQGLDLTETDSGLVQGVIGPLTARRLFQAFIAIEQNPPHQVNALIWNRPFALLGRDILNNYIITLDGPNLTLTISG